MRIQVFIFILPLLAHIRVINLFLTESTLYTSTIPLRRNVIALKLSVQPDPYQQQHLNNCAVTSSPSATSLLRRLPRLVLMDVPISGPSLTPRSLRERALIL
jgi:hypothetical protein